MHWRRRRRTATGGTLPQSPGHPSPATCISNLLCCFEGPWSLGIKTAVLIQFPLPSFPALPHPTAYPLDGGLCYFTLSLFSGTSETLSRWISKPFTYCLTVVNLLCLSEFQMGYL